VNLQEAASNIDQDSSVNCFAQILISYCATQTIERRLRLLKQIPLLLVVSFSLIFLSALSSEHPFFKSEGMSDVAGTSSGGEGGEEHLKNDGTLDMRYSSSKEAVAEMGADEGTTEISEGS
jgi:hypothetical protein